jgi:hypothetical protein
MAPAVFARLKARDGGRCVHCGRDDDTLVPGHRRGRGHGGSKAREVLSNVVTMCSTLNNDIEISAAVRNAARRRGWSLVEGQDPASTPFWNVTRQRWEQPDDDGGITVVDRPHPTRGGAL